MVGVREDAEHMGVDLVKIRDRFFIKASNEAGHNCTLVDLADLIAWLKANRPELI